MISGIDKVARKMGVSRQSVMKTWINEKLKG
jgi:DNA-binding phage protein